MKTTDVSQRTQSSDTECTEKKQKRWTRDRTDALFERLNSRGNECMATVLSCTFGYLESRIQSNPQARLSEFFDCIEERVQRLEANAKAATASSSVPSVGRAQ